MLKAESSSQNAAKLLIAYINIATLTNISRDLHKQAAETNSV